MDQDKVAENTRGAREIGHGEIPCLAWAQTVFNIWYQIWWIQHHQDWNFSADTWGSTECCWVWAPNQTKLKEKKVLEQRSQIFLACQPLLHFLFMVIRITVHGLPWESCTSGDLAWTCHTLAFGLLLEKLPIPFIRKEMNLHLSKLLEANRKAPPVESKAALAPCHTFYPRNFQEAQDLIGIAFMPGKPPWFLNTRKAQELLYL